MNQKHCPHCGLDLPVLGEDDEDFPGFREFHKPLRAAVRDMLEGRLPEPSSLKEALDSVGLPPGNLHCLALFDILAHPQEYAESLLQFVLARFESYGYLAEPPGTLRDDKKDLIKRGERMIRKKVEDGWITPEQAEEQIRNMRDKIENANLDEMARRARENWDAIARNHEALKIRFPEVPHEKFKKAILKVAEWRKTLGRREILSKLELTHCVVYDEEHYPASLVAAFAVNKCQFPDIDSGIEPCQIVKAVTDFPRVLQKAGLEVIPCNCGLRKSGS